MKLHLQIHGGLSFPVVSLIHLPYLVGIACRAKTVSKHIFSYCFRRGECFRPYDN
jgi:hypothetical protein